MPTRRKILAWSAGVGGLLGGVSSGAFAQSPFRRIGVIVGTSERDAETVARIEALRRSLQAYGWVDGETATIDYRYANGNADALRRNAEALVASQPDVIVASGTFVIVELKRLTTTIPVIAALVIDPVGFGFAESLSRPGTNITGFNFINPGLVGKWKGLLSEAAPGTRRSAVLYNPRIQPYYPAMLASFTAAIPSSPVELIPTPVETTEAIRAALVSQAATPGGSLMIGPEAFVFSHMRQVADWAVELKLPGISVYRQYAQFGGLISYGPDVIDIFRRTADYVDRVLRGANPAELPIQQPVAFECLLNLKTAGALRLDWPATFLAQADEVIE
ncbi:ABC transporter substrate-binding protein [uncultured Alsobacter sp.]|uniref:ABC transporter substrate-binding protein n=1 Tax=uncultured Alsobacter sp. TaxID=1748258 RepID=UPI0025CE61FD|nr:ABC transporter substrate-binding protein [uncultured Alsobacter sp.]